MGYSMDRYGFFFGVPYKKENGPVFYETILIEYPHKPGMSVPEQASMALSVI